MNRDVILRAVMVTSLSLMTSVRATYITHVLWRQAFSSDVINAGHHSILTQVSRTTCAGRCANSPSCVSFAHHEESATCWMYSYVVDYAHVGASFPGTRFYWPMRSECPAPYTLTSGVCHYVGTGETWLQARDHCRNDGGILFIANTPERLSLLKTLSNNGVDAVGGTDIEVEGDWRWLNGDLITAGWKPGEPNDMNDADCLFLKAYQMLDDVPCHLGTGFMCEIPYTAP